MELELQRSLPNLIHLIGSFSSTLKHLQELLRTKSEDIGALWEVPPWLNEKERPSSVKNYPGAGGTDSVDQNLLDLGIHIKVKDASGKNAQDTDGKTSLAVEKVVETTREEKAAALDHICSILEPLARVGADLRARELEKVFHGNSRGHDVDQDILVRGNQSAHGPNIQVVRIFRVSSFVPSIVAHQVAH
jgi:hypothetical protein